MEDAKQEVGSARKGRPEPVLTNAERLELCRYLAEFNQISEAVNFVRKEFGKEISYMGVKTYFLSPKWRHIIDDLRAKFLKSFMDVPIAQKRIRLERLETLFQKALESGKISTAREVLSSAALEVEGPKSNFSAAPGLIFNQFNLMSDEEIEHRRKSIIERISRLSNKSGEADSLTLPMEL